jgi:hypothetical protein
MSEKRSQEVESAQMSLPLPGLAGGVGARHGGSVPGPGGGGYLDICTSAEFQKKKAATPQKNGAPRDPRLNDLRRIGLQSVWLDVAEEIGVDAFMRIWRIIDAAPECAYNDTALRVPIRMYRVFLRFQRNQYIRELAGSGLSFSAIKRRVARQLGEQVSIRHIKRIAASE